MVPRPFQRQGFCMTEARALLDSAGLPTLEFEAGVRAAKKKAKRRGSGVSAPLTSLSAQAKRARRPFLLCRFMILPL